MSSDEITSRFRAIDCTTNQGIVEEQYLVSIIPSALTSYVSTAMVAPGASY